MHGWNQPEGNGSTGGQPSMIICKWHAIAVKMGWGKIKDVVIRPGSLAVATVIYVSQLCNPSLVCIREGLCSWDSAIGNGKGVKGNLLSTYIVHGLLESPRESRRAWQITLSWQRRKTHSTIWENTSRWAIWVVSCWTWPGPGVVVRSS
jgi:hypothetical protein